MLNVECLNCNFCAINCPLYQNFPIEINSPRYFVKAQKLDVCLLCGKCEIDCPPGIKIVEVVKKKSNLNMKYEFNPMKKEKSVLLFTGCELKNFRDDIKNIVYNWAKKNNFQVDNENCCGYFLSSDDERLNDIKKYFFLFERVIFLCPHGFSFWKNIIFDKAVFYLAFIDVFPENTFFSCNSQNQGYNSEITEKIKCCGSGGIVFKHHKRKELKKIRDNFNNKLKKECFFDCPFCYNAYNGKKRILWEMLK